MTAPYYQDDLVQRGVDAMRSLAAVDTIRTPRTDEDYVRAILEAASQQVFDLEALA